MEEKNFHTMLVIPDNGLSAYSYRKALSTFKNALGVKSYKGISNLFIFTVRETDINSAKAKVYDALKLAGNTVGLASIRYIMSMGTSRVIEDITVCDVRKYTEELGLN